MNLVFNAGLLFSIMLRPKTVFNAGILFFILFLSDLVFNDNQLNKKEIDVMANAATLAKYSNDMRRFEHSIRKIIGDIDRRKKSGEADEAVMEKHLVHTCCDSKSRRWRFE